MIVVTKVDLHTLKLNKLNEMIDAGYEPVAWVPYGNRMVIFLEGDEEKKIVTSFYDGSDISIDEDIVIAEEGVEIKDTICVGTTVAGNPCKGARFEGTEYCVAHQDQG